MRIVVIVEVSLVCRSCRQSLDVPVHEYSILDELVLLLLPPL